MLRGLTLVLYGMRGIVFIKISSLILIARLPPGHGLRAPLQMIVAMILGVLAIAALAGIWLTLSRSQTPGRSYLAMASLVLHVIALAGAAIHLQIASPVDNPALVRIVNSLLLTSLVTGQLLYLLFMRQLAIDIDRVDIRLWIDIAMVVVGASLFMASLSLIINIASPELHLAPGSLRIPFPIAVLLGLFAFLIFTDAVRRLRKGLMA